jgi:NPCBM/NEW2 domain
MSMSFTCPKCDETFRRVVGPDSEIVCPTCGWKLPHPDDAERERVESEAKSREGGRRSRRSSRREDDNDDYDPLPRRGRTKRGESREGETLSKLGLAIWLICGAIYVLGLIVTVFWIFAAVFSLFLTVICFFVFVVKYSIKLIREDGVGIWLANLFVPFFAPIYAIRNWGRLGKKLLPIVGCFIAAFIAWKWADVVDQHQQVAKWRAIPREPIPNERRDNPSLAGKGIYGLSNLKEFGYFPGPPGWEFAKIGDIGDRDRTRIVVQGLYCTNGLGMHPPDPARYTRICYDLSGKANRFKGTVALNDNCDPQSAVRFEVLGDERSLWKSRPIARPRVTQNFDIDVTGVEVLQLRVYAEVRPSNGCHAVWFSPVVVIE